MKIEVLDEYREKWTNNGGAAVMTYEYRGTSKERAVCLKPGESKVINVKEKPKTTYFDNKKKKSDKPAEKKDRLIDISTTAEVVDN